MNPPKPQKTKKLKKDSKRRRAVIKVFKFQIKSEAL